MKNLIPKPFASAHRAGNSREDALAAIRAGADLLEADIWLHDGRLELRHKQTLGPIPILWERWAIAPGWKPRYLLRELLQDVPEDVLPFLDFKGDEVDLGPEVLKELQHFAPGRTVAICGRNYPQLLTIAESPNIICFYSVGANDEWPIAQKLIEGSSFPALSIKASLVTPERMDWMKSRGGTVVSWNVTSEQQVRRFRELGVDGFTTSNLDLVSRIRQLRESHQG